jgi:hypothetical protein
MPSWTKGRVALVGPWVPSPVSRVGNGMENIDISSICNICESPGATKPIADVAARKVNGILIDGHHLDDSPSSKKGAYIWIIIFVNAPGFADHSARIAGA